MFGATSVTGLLAYLGTGYFFAYSESWVPVLIPIGAVGLAAWGTGSVYLFWGGRSPDRFPSWSLGARRRDDAGLEDPFQKASMTVTSSLIPRRACARGLRASVTISAVSVAILYPAFGASGQGSPTPPETSWLSAAIEELRLSPFHATESALHLGTLTPIGIGAPNGLRVPMEAYSPASIQSARSDSTLSRGRVFLTSWVFAATSDFAAFYLGLGGYSWLAFPTPILGTAFGATLGGARFGPALAGSAVSLGVVLGMFATGLVVDPDDNFLAFIVIPATIQAGITTWIASAFD